MLGSKFWCFLILCNVTLLGDRVFKEVISVSWSNKTGKLKRSQDEPTTQMFSVSIEWYADVALCCVSCLVCRALLWKTDTPVHRLLHLCRQLWWAALTVCVRACVLPCYMNRSKSHSEHCGGFAFQKDFTIIIFSLFANPQHISLFKTCLQSWIRVELSLVYLIIIKIKFRMVKSTNRWKHTSCEFVLCFLCPFCWWLLDHLLLICRVLWKM